ncbi:MAG TPA: twin-arginine translocase TatA/TatE family subunit [Actinomycetes bacterium]|nr:twin-arginine translocase TatA/TatE family subunit [Actinomycetes bacterium]
MFNVGLGEIVAIVLVTLLLFGPEKLPEMARQAGRFLGRLRLTTQDALDQLKDEADLKDLNLPDLRIGSLRSQARDYVRELMDVEGQMAELEREREELKAALAGEQNGDGASGDAAKRSGDGASGSSQASTADLGPPPVDPEAT